jgi:two-component system KDP operon response regulator KdpE
MKLLVVDDDREVLDAVVAAVETRWADAEIVKATKAGEAIGAFVTHNPDLVVLDVGLPDQNGFDVLCRIRGLSDVPVVMLTGHSKDTDVVRGLRLGADVYVTKPFSATALLARCEALYRRCGTGPPPTPAKADFTAGDLSISFANRDVRLRGKRVHLTPREYKLLHHLVVNAGRVVPHARLIDHVWDGDRRIGMNHLKAMVKRLRGKIELAPAGDRFVEREYGLGYRFAHRRAPR